MRSPILHLAVVFALVAASCGDGSSDGNGDVRSTEPGSPGASTAADDQAGPAASPVSDGFDGLWLLVAAEVDGEVVASDLHLEIDGSTISGETVCGQRFGGELGGPFERTPGGCDAEGRPDLQSIEARLMEAVAESPRFDGELLVFSTDGVDLTYRRTVEVTAVELFSALDDETLSADPSELYVDPEGGGLPRFDRLVRLEHPSPAASFYVGTAEGLVCLVMSSDTAVLTSCQEPRKVALGTQALHLTSSEGRTLVRAALVPDAFVDAAATELSSLGAVTGNVLVVDPDAEPGEYRLTAAGGEQFVLTVG